MIKLICFYGIITFLFKFKKYKLVYFFCFIITLMFLKRIDFSGFLTIKFFLFSIIGYVISPLIVTISYVSTFFVRPKIEFSYRFSPILLCDVLLEEYLWRHLFLLILLNMRVSLIENLLISVIQLFLFIFSHSNIKKRKDFLEMYKYSCLLLLTAYLLPGMNVGLHLGRNVCCSNAREVCNEGL